MNCNSCSNEVPQGEVFYEDGCLSCAAWEEYEPEDCMVMINTGNGAEKFKFDCINDTWAFYPIN